MRRVGGRSRQATNDASNLPARRRQYDANHGLPASTEVFRPTARARARAVGLNTSVLAGRP